MPQNDKVEVDVSEMKNRIENLELNQMSLEESLDIFQREVEEQRQELRGEFNLLMNFIKKEQNIQSSLDEESCDYFWLISTIYSLLTFTFIIKTFLWVIIISDDKDIVLRSIQAALVVTAVAIKLFLSGINYLLQLLENYYK